MFDFESYYTDRKIIPGRGLCALGKMLFTTALFYNIEDDIYEGRWCYKTYEEAKAALEVWDGAGDPPGLWRKHYGVNSYYNPLWKKMVNYVEN